MEGRSGQPFAARIATSWNLQVPAATTLGSTVDSVLWAG